MSIKAVYEQYKHLGFIVEDPNYASDFKSTILHNLWCAIRDEALHPQLNIEPAVLMDTAVLLEEEADKVDIGTAIVYRQRAADFRAAAQRREETLTALATCCSCQRTFPAGNMSAICERCYEDKIA